MGKYQPFFDLPAAQFAGLVDDIAKRGVLLPILVDEDDRTIDGHQRRRAAAEAGVDCPKVVVAGLTEDEKQTLALTLNLFRRHLSGTERSKALQQLANLGLSTRRMADLLGVSKSTVHRDLADVERPESVTDSIGRQQPSSKPARDVSQMGHVEGIDPETGEVLPSGDPTPQPAAGGDVPQVDSSAASPPAVDPALGYRARGRAEEDKVRGGLLTLDPERLVATTDEPDVWRSFSKDVRRWLDALDAELSGPKLKAVR